MLSYNAKIPPGVGSVLFIDLNAIARNYGHLQSLAPDAKVGVSVKADAYGLGVLTIAPVLAAAGCQTFFVASAAEGQRLRPSIPDAEIVVLNGPDTACLPLFTEHRLTPALNSLAQIDVWRTIATENPQTEAAYLHLDTGMARLGLGEDELSELCADATRLGGIKISVVMSHLACADDPGSPMNALQRDRLVAAKTKLAPLTGTVEASLANSAGIFLGSGFHMDLARAGAAIYGLNVLGEDISKMEQTVHLYAKILQVRDIDRDETVGYGATHRADRVSRIATVSTGYADGYPRAAGRLTEADTRPTATAYVDDVAVPVVGRISMDLLAVDVTNLPAATAQPGAFVELIGTHFGTDDLAEVSGTIGYEILTRLGQRHYRIYRGGDTA